MICNENSLKIMSILSTDVEGCKWTRAYKIDKKVCAVSLTHLLFCNINFVHYVFSIGALDKRQKFGEVYNEK
jgi:hypothetical protein